MGHDDNFHKILMNEMHSLKRGQQRSINNQLKLDKRIDKLEIHQSWIKTICMAIFGWLCFR